MESRRWQLASFRLIFCLFVAGSDCDRSHTAPNWVANWVGCAWSLARGAPTVAPMQHLLLLSCFTSFLWRRVRAVALLPFLLLTLLPAQAASAQSSGFITSGWTITPVSGTINVLVVGCYFSDTDDPAVLSRATDGIKKMYGSANEQPTISHYFNRVSNGNVQICCS